MAITLTLVNTKLSVGGDNASALYSAAISGTYPSGGYTVAAANLPGAVAKFKKIQRVRFERDGGMDSNGNMYRIDSVDNSDSTDPSFVIKGYEFATGGVGVSEIPVGQAHTATIYVEVEGIPKNGVITDPW